jgi:hypothetical protein
MPSRVPVIDINPRDAIAGRPLTAGLPITERRMSTKKLTLAIILLIIHGCDRSTNPTTAPVQSAYTDGFEVIVIETADDGTISSARSLPLKEAESLVSNNPQFGFAITDTNRIEQLLTADNSQQGDFSINITTTNTDASQVIRTSFHYSSKTYWYEYKITGDNVSPLSSGYTDLQRNASVQYIDDND